MLQGKGGCPGLAERLIPLTVPEVRRLLTRLVWRADQPANFILSWSLWRRYHQAQGSTGRVCNCSTKLESTEGVENKGVLG